MKTKLHRINSANNLFWYFLATQLGFYVAPFFSRPPLEIDIDISHALICHTVSLLAFAFGYGLNALLNMPYTKKKKAKSTDGKPGDVAAGHREANHLKLEDAEMRQLNAMPRWKFLPEFFIAAYVLMFIGTFIVILQVSISQSPVEYLHQLLTGDFSSNIRKAFLTTSGEGGLSGALKIFGAVPLSVYLFSLSIPHFLELSPTDYQKFSRLNIAALICTAVKIFFSLDRLTIIAIIITNVFITVRTRKNLPIKFFLVGLFVFLIEFVSRRRVSDVGGVDFIILYYNWTLVNFQLLLDTLQGHTYGISSIFGPVVFIARFFGYSDLGLSSTHDFRLDDPGAQYLLGLVYQDFGFMFPIFFVILGYIYKTIDRKALVQGNIYYVSIYLLTLSLTMTYAATPAFKSVDFWLGLMVPLILVRFFTRRVRRRTIDFESGSDIASPLYTKSVPLRSALPGAHTLKV